jgi:hypothetical protein
MARRIALNAFAFAALTCAAFLCACSDGNANATATSAPVEVTPPEMPSSERATNTARPDPSTLPVSEDYEAKARREITKDNYKQELERLEHTP